MSVVRYLKALSYDVWVLHDLTETKLVDYISICNSMFNHSKNDSFFFKKKNNMQWKIDCNNLEQKSSREKRKVDLHAKVVRLCIWWIWSGIVDYELLPHEQTLNSHKYSSQLNRLKAAIYKKRKEIADEIPAPRLFEDPIGIGTAWMGCPSTPAIFTRLRIILILTKFS